MLMYFLVHILGKPHPKTSRYYGAGAHGAVSQKVLSDSAPLHVTASSYGGYGKLGVTTVQYPYSGYDSYVFPPKGVTLPRGVRVVFASPEFDGGKVITLTDGKRHCPHPYMDAFIHVGGKTQVMGCWAVVTNEDADVPTGLYVGPKDPEKPHYMQPIKVQHIRDGAFKYYGETSLYTVFDQIAQLKW